jgi:Helitron helicase-like domain at N-terminus
MFGNWNIINEKIASTIPAFIRTGDSYFRNAESNIAAMIKVIRLSQLFLTLIFSERWPQFLKRIQGSHEFLCSFMSDPLSQRPIPTNFPWEAVEYYYERIYHLRRYFLSIPSASSYGRLRESVMRFEFQLRQAIHTHMLLWIERSMPELIQNNYIRADIPDPIKEKELYDLVITHQIHTYQLHLCGKPPGHNNVNNPCVKGFPQPLSPITYHQSGEL